MLIKIWSADRKNRCMLIINESATGILQQIIREGKIILSLFKCLYIDSQILFYFGSGSRKLGIVGIKIVLENDGSVIDEDAILLSVAKETFILLEDGQRWIEPTEIEKNIGDPNNTFINLPNDNNLDEGTVQNVVIINTAPENVSNVEALVNLNVNNENANCNEEYRWHEFSMPWQKVPTNLLVQCEAGNRVPQTITSIVHFVVDEMRTISTKIPTKAFKIQAVKMSNKFPKMFRDIDEDKVVIGDGCSAVQQKLLDRHNYLNRPHKRPIKPSTDNSNPVHVKKSLMSAKAGCSNWNPAILPNVNGLEEREKEYPLQRQFINENLPNVNSLREKWPNFWKIDEIFWHFEKLTSSKIDLIQKLTSERYEKILLFAESKKLLPHLFFQSKQSDVNCMLMHILEIFAFNFREDITVFMNLPVKTIISYKF